MVGLGANVQFKMLNIIYTRSGRVTPGEGERMHNIKISFVKDEKTGRKLVFASCNDGEMFVQPWSQLDDQIQMILRAVANPETCEIEIIEKGFEDIKIEK